MAGRSSVPARRIGLRRMRRCYTVHARRQNALHGNPTTPAPIAIRAAIALEVTHMVEQDFLQTHREAIRAIAGRHGVTRVRVFGSVARGEATSSSDLDLLIETGPETSAWFPAGLILDLEQLLGRRVEVVTERALNPAIRERVLQEARPL
jgi:uncharacterized protein